MAQDEDLDVLSAIGAGEQGKPAERPQYGQVSESHCHKYRQRLTARPLHSQMPNLNIPSSGTRDQLNGRYRVVGTHRCHTATWRFTLARRAGSGTAGNPVTGERPRYAYAAGLAAVRILFIIAAASATPSSRSCIQSSFSMDRTSS